MRVVSLVVILLIVGAIGAGVYYRDYLFKVAKGAVPAKSADEACSKFKQFIKDRDYESAAVYCTAEYAEQLRKAAKAGTELASAIDNLTAVMEDNGVKSARVGFILHLLQPFPKDLEYAVKDDKATFTVKAQGVDASVDLAGWKDSVDPGMFWTYLGGPPSVGGKVSPTMTFEGTVKKEGEFYKLAFPATPGVQQTVEKLKSEGQNYAKALTKVKQDVKTDATTKNDIEARLKSELNDAKK